MTIEITPQETREILASREDILLLDCRTPQEHAIARIDGERLVPMDSVPERLDELEAFRSSPVVVYCHSGRRSLTVARFLREQGFTDVRSMAGGIDRWSVEIDPNVPRY